MYGMLMTFPQCVRMTPLNTPPIPAGIKVAANTIPVATIRQRTHEETASASSESNTIQITEPMKAPVAMCICSPAQGFTDMNDWKLNRYKIGIQVTADRNPASAVNFATTY